MAEQSSARVALGIDSVAASRLPSGMGSRIDFGEEDDLDLSLSTEKSLNLKESLESWDLNPKDIAMEKELGKGAFGVVYLGKLRGQHVAVKKLNKQNLDEKAMKSFKTEIEIMSKLRHPNVLLFMGACTVPGNLMIVTELMPKGNLKVLLQKVDIPFKIKMSFAKQIAGAMSWLHTNDPPFIHRDLKTSNILVGRHNVVKVADFGLSFAKKEEEKGNFGTVGTPLWMAPEVLSKKPYSEKADLYSFALVLWEIITKKTPYSNIHSLEELVDTVVTKGKRPVIPENLPSNLKKVLKKSWSADPASRPAFADLVGLFDIISCNALINLGPNPDKNGVKLWKKYFLTKEGLRYYVTFEEFVKVYCKVGKLKYDLKAIHFKCLKAVLCRDGKNVRIEDYGIVLQRFGPLDNPEKFLSRIVSLLKKSWFHGEISSDKAEKLVMSSEKNGTFVVRFSSDPGSYAVTARSKSGKPKHFRIYHKAGLDFLIGKIECKSIEEIIRKYYKELFLKYPARGSPFEKLFNSQKQKKRSEMSAGYQVANIN